MRNPVPPHRPRLAVGDRADRCRWSARRVSCADRNLHSLLPGLPPGARDPGAGGPLHRRESVAGASGSPEAAGTAYHSRPVRGPKVAGREAAGAADPFRSLRGQAALFAV